MESQASLARPGRYGSFLEAEPGMMARMAQQSAPVAIEPGLSAGRSSADAAQPSGPPSGAALIKMDQVFRNACVGGLTMASSFGVMAAAHNVVRNSPVFWVRVAAASGPIVAGGVSAAIEPHVERLVGTRATMPPHSPYQADADGLIFPAILPSCFMAANYAWQFLPIKNRPVPTTPQGMAVTIGVSAAGSFLGKGLMEWWAQHQHAVHGTAGQPLPYRLRTSDELAVGRMRSQVPAAALHLGLAVAFRGGSVPAVWGRAYPAAMGVPYAARGLLTPGDDAPVPPAKPHPAAQSAPPPQAPG